MRLRTGRCSFAVIPRTMNTLCRLLLLASLIAAISANAQLANAGFENTSVIGEDTIPDDWSVTSGFGGGAIMDGNTGDWSLGVWHWYWYGPGIAANGSSAEDGHEGTSFTGHPVALNGFYKRYTGDLQEDQSDNDSGRVTVLLTRWNAVLFQRDTVAIGAQAFGERPEWSPFSIGLDHLLSGDPDTLVVRVLSGIDCFCGMQTNGTCCYLYLDDLSVELENGILAPIVDERDAHVVAVGDGVVEVRVDDPSRLPMTLRLDDAIGRSLDVRTIRSDRERIRVPGSTGVVAYGLSDGHGRVAHGKVMPW